MSFNFIDAKIGLLVGVNCPEILKPLNVVNTIENFPCATKHLFGLVINGPNNNSLKPNNMCFRTKINSCLDDKIDKVFNCDFVDEPGVHHQLLIKYEIIKLEVVYKENCQ